MSGPQLLALLPYLTLAGAAVVVMLGIAARRSHALALTLTLAGLAATLAALPSAAGVAPLRVTALLTVDAVALLYLALAVVGAAVVALLAAGYLERQAIRREEFYVLLLTGTLGAGVLAAASHFASFLLGLEILSVSLYGLVAYQYERPSALEAGVKYLVLAGTSSAFLLFGMALIYAQTGVLELAGLPGLTALPAASALVCVVGAVLLLVGIGFKLGIVPFHLWTPDIYQGAPAPVGAFIATVSKGAVLALLLRWFLAWDLREHHALGLVFPLLAVASMLAGNLLALLQTNVKRILGYSSIAHMGYVLVAFSLGGPAAASAVTFYLIAYFITMLGAFGVIAVLSDGEREPGEIADFRGLAWRRPWLTAVFVAMLLSLAGIPLTAGFMGKAYILARGVEVGEWGLLLVLAVASVVGLYYYLRIVMALFSRPDDGVVRSLPGAPALGGFALAILLLLLVGLGVYPGPTLTAIVGLVGEWF